MTVISIADTTDHVADLTAEAVIELSDDCLQFDAELAANGTRPALSVLDIGLRSIPPYVPAPLRQLSTAVIERLRETEDAARNTELYEALGLELDDMPGNYEETEAAMQTRSTLSRLFDQRAAGHAPGLGAAPAGVGANLSEESQKKADLVARIVNRVRPVRHPDLKLNVPA